MCTLPRVDTWELADFPLEPQDPPTVVEVTGALLTKVERGPLRIYGRPNRYIKGAVYDAKRHLVVESQKAAVPNYPWVAADPSKLSQRGNVRRTLRGRWLYGGHWMQHFGHFLIETLPTLWPEATGLDGLVFHKYHRMPSSVEPWMQRALDLVGMAGLPVDVVGTGSGVIEVENLVVPGRPVVPGGWAHPQAREVWMRLGSQFVDPAAPRLVFLSRTRFNAARDASGDATGTKARRTSAERDRELDHVFSEAGFAVVSPEELPIDEQFRLFANAEVLAGCSGSALHMSAFAPEGAKVIEVGDSRNADRPQRTQLVIDALREHRRLFVPAGASAQSISETLSRLDLSR